MAYVQVPDLLYKGQPLYVADDSTVATPPPVVVTPPPVIVAPLPLVLVTKGTAIKTNLPWVNGTRIHSITHLGPSVYWAIAFIPTSSSTARFVGAEDGGGPVMREYIIYRVDTGEIVGQGPRPLSTVQARLGIDRAVDPRYFEVAVHKNVPYVMAITTDPLQPPSAMFMDLFLS